MVHCGMLLKITLAIALLLCASTAVAQHPPGHQSLHDHFYSTWKMPDRRYQGARYVSCCSDRDCYPTAFKNIDGIWFAFHRETGKWIVVPPAKIEQNTVDPRESPDGQGHLCAGSSGAVYCAVLGVMT